MNLAFTDQRRPLLYVPATALSDHAENRDRIIYQSARTVAGKLAPLPLSEAEAWQAAPAEYSARLRHG